MFRFDFSDLDLEDDEGHPIDKHAENKPASEQEPSGIVSESSEPQSKMNAGECDTLAADDGVHGKAHELSFEALAQALPPAFSYAPLVVPLYGDVAVKQTSSDVEKQTYSNRNRSITLLRRDLFDARYQLISEDNETGAFPADAAAPSGDGLNASSPANVGSRKRVDALEFIDNPSDLVPGVYEGGLKTWECSLDLVDYLASLENGGREGVDWVRGKRVIEIGCGTAMPSLYLLRTLFSHPQTAGSNADSPSTEIVLQDYNDLVLRLVTFPNVLLAWYASPLAEAYRSQYPTIDDELGEEPFDPTQPGDMHITPELLSAFRASLEEQRISIRFITGSWQALSHDNTQHAFPFDVTLTSETIYQMSSLPSLVALLKRAAWGSKRDSDIQTMARDLSLEGPRRLCLVAAKVLYFGVGGGVTDFERVISRSGGKTTTMLQRKTGVGRKVMNVEWT